MLQWSSPPVNFWLIIIFVWVAPAVLVGAVVVAIGALGATLIPRRRAVRRAQAEAELLALAAETEPVPAA